jgi:hypothetical protein
MKNCYICLPINNQEHDVFERAKKAKQKVINLGMNPICPLEINEQNKDNINFHTNMVPQFMGNDIKTLIGECDAIYICNGWETSKGCNVEIECAKQYSKEIFWEKVPYTLSAKEYFETFYRYYDQKYQASKEKYGENSFQADMDRDNYNIFDNEVRIFMDYERD